MKYVFTLALVAAGVTANLTAQTSTATLGGFVTDPQESAVAGAKITITGQRTAFERTTVSAPDGLFQLPQLSPGAYILSVERDGFNTARFDNITLNVNDQQSLRVQLTLAQKGETISVFSDAPLVSESPAVATTIDRQFFENQPLNGRSFQSLISLTPGAVPAPANLVTPGQFSINGQRATANYFTIDGVSANFASSASVTPYENGGGAPALSSLGSTNTLASVDAVQEFTIQTSTFAPEYGRQPGGQISIVTRSGGNQFHGTLFNYLRNAIFDANSFFANAAGLPRAAIKQNDFGGVFGGPVLRNRTFFFVSYEGLRLRQPFVTVPLTVPSLSARAAATGPVKELLDAFPLPTGPALASDPTTAPYQANFSNPSTLNATSFRIDHSFNSKFTLFGRYNYAPSENQERARFCAASCVSDTASKTETFTAGSTAVISSALVNDLRFNYSRSKTVLSYFIDTFGGARIPAPSTLYPSFTDGSKGYIYIQVDGAGDNTISDGLFADNRQRQINVVDTVSFAKGAHSIKIGFDYRRLAPISDSGSYRRQFNPNSIALLTQGFSQNAFILSPEFVLKPVYTNFSSYIQDAWRIGARLTLTGGLRWDINPAPSESGGHYPPTVVGLDNLAAISLAPRGDRFYGTDYKGFAPRIGLAYQPFNSHGTSIRVGAGLFYDLGTSFLGNAFSTSLFPNARRTDFTRIAYGDPVFAAQPPAVNLNPPYQRIFAYESGYRLPYSVQYSFAVEQPFSAKDSLKATYVGSSGQRLSRVTSYRNPNPNFTRIDAVTNDASSNYNSLQVQYRRRFSAGLQTLLSYTYSKSLDTVSEESINNFQAPAERVSPNQDRGPSSFDIRNSFNGAVSYNLPGRGIFGGFGIDGIVRAQSAAPVNILSNRDPFGLGLNTVARPDLVPGQPLYLYDDSFAGGRRFNRAAFNSDLPLAQGRQGTLGRNVLRAFPLTQFDLSLRRTFQFTERIGLQFRADAFNLLNHANFAAPSGILTASTFGRSTQTAGSGLGGLSSLFQVGGPRSLQLALKLQF